MATRTYVYFDQNQGWSEHTTQFHDAAVYLNERYLGFSGMNGIVKSLEGSVLFPTTMASPAPTATISTGWIRLGGPGALARVRRIETTLKMDSTDTFTVNMYRDFIPDVYKQRLDLVLGEHPKDTSPSTTQERVLALDGWGNRLTTVKFEFIFDAMSVPFIMEGLTIFFTGGANLRGERHSAGVGGEAALAGS